MRTTSLARRLGSVTLVAALSLTAAACGNEDDSSNDDGSNSSSEGSSGEETEEEADELEELATDEFYPAIMEAMQEAETFEMASTTTSNGQSQEMEGQARYGEDGMEMKATSVGGDGEDVEMILVDDFMYMKADSMTTDGKWIALDLTDESNPLAKLMSRSVDPEAMMGAEYAPKNVELVGQEEIDGVETNHYVITIDPSQALEDMDMEGLEDYLPEEMEMEMWVDADNLPRKFIQVTEVKSPTGSGTVTSETEGYYTDFGTDIEIEAPAEDEISEENPFQM